MIELTHASFQYENSDRGVQDISLSVKSGECVVLTGLSGCGKTTVTRLVNGLAPSYYPGAFSGIVKIDGKDISRLSTWEIGRLVGSVFQDPKMGTAPRMTVAENLLIAEKRGQKRQLTKRTLAHRNQDYLSLLAKTGNGLEKHLETPTGLLSGGQRQALSLLMATIKRPDLLLLDEHTAALDPKTSKSLMNLTNQFVNQAQLTALMITHHMEDALTFGNRLIVMKDGKIIQDLDQTLKAQMTISDYYQLFE